MALDIDFDADIAQAVSDLAGSFIWKGDAYAAVIDPIVLQEELEGMEGFRNVIGFLIVVQTSLFSSATPAIGDTVTVSGTVYRVDIATTDEASAAINMQIVGLTQ